MTFASQIPRPITPCNEFLNSGSEIYVGELLNCAKEPATITFTVDAATVIGDETISLTVSGVTEYTLRAGYVLPFTAEDVIVTTETTVTSVATPVPVQALTTAFAGSETVDVWNAYKLISPTNIPLNLSKVLVDATTLDSPQKRDATVARMLDSAITLIATPDDLALWTVVAKAADSDQNIFAAIFRTSRQVGFGEALVENYTTDGPIDEIERPNFNVKFQGDDYRYVTRWDYAPMAEQTVINNMRVLLGLPVYA